MRRRIVRARPDWTGLADAVGFTTAGDGYWTDDACYEFRRAEIEGQIKPAIEDLWQMSLAVVDLACRDEQVLASLGVPARAWDAIRSSRRAGEPSLATRFDLAVSATAPPKLHECNGDTPGLLFEAAVFQWLWLEDQAARGAIEADADQFNRLHEALVAAFGRLHRAAPIHAAASNRNTEDRVLARYLADCALQAGHRVVPIAIEEIGIDVDGAPTDLSDHPIRVLLKAYRWHRLLTEPFAPSLVAPDAPRVIEPLWTVILASKGLLVWLWRLFPGHPNLLAAWFEGDAEAPRDRCAVKPLFSIKGRNVTLHDPSLPGGAVATDGPYGGEGRIVQALHYLPAFERAGRPVHASVGGWIVDGRAEGIGVVEDDGPIVISERCRFVPHLVRD